MAYGSFIVGGGGENPPYWRCRRHHRKNITGNTL